MRNQKRRRLTPSKTTRRKEPDFNIPRLNIYTYHGLVRYIIADRELDVFCIDLRDTEVLGWYLKNLKNGKDADVGHIARQYKEVFQGLYSTKAEVRVSPEEIDTGRQERYAIERLLAKLSRKNSGNTTGSNSKAKHR